METPVHKFAALCGYVAFAVVVVTAVALATARTEHLAGYDHDGRFYAAMAGDPVIKASAAKVAPMCWRLVTPAIVAGVARVCATDVLGAFTIVGFASNVLTLLLVIGVLRRVGTPAPWALAGATLYAGIFWTVKFTFHSPAYIDHQTMLFLWAIVWLIVHERFVAVIPALAVAVVQKESLAACGIAAWIAFAGRSRFISARSFGYLAAVLALPGAIIVALRYAIEPFDVYSSGVALYHLKNALEASFWPRFALSVWSGLGVIPLLVLARPGLARRTLGEHRALFALLVIGGLFLLGGRDKARLFLYMLPPLVIVGTAALRHLTARGGPRAVAWLLATFALHFWLGHHLSPIASFRDYLITQVPIHAPDGTVAPRLAIVAGLLVGWVVLTVALLGRRRNEPVRLMDSDSGTGSDSNGTDNAAAIDAKGPPLQAPRRAVATK